MRRSAIFWLGLLAALLGSGSTFAAAGPLTLARVVLVMRHGIRPPTKAPAMPAGFTGATWPDWPVAPGYLTPHGATAIRLLAGYERSDFAAAGLLPAAGCPQAGDVAIWADTDERTIKTGEAFAGGFAPGCGLPTGHAITPDDPLFSPMATGTVDFDPAQARAAILAHAGPGGLQAVAASHRPELARLQTVLGCCAVNTCASFSIAAPCGLPELPTTLAGEGSREVKLQGALDKGSTLAEILLLEYLDGKPMADVGFGRIDRAGLLRALALHPLEFDLLKRPSYIAERGASPLLHRIVAALRGGADTPRLSVFVGHDTTLAYLGGALDLHWNPDDYPRDDPPPGATLGFERLRDARGEAFIRIFFTVQSPDQMRALSRLTFATPPAKIYLAIPGCGSPAGHTTCPLAIFDSLVLQHSVPLLGRP